MRETEILVEQQPPQGVLVCDHAGLVINKFSQDWSPDRDWVVKMAGNLGEEWTGAHANLKRSHVLLLCEQKFQLE